MKGLGGTGSRGLRGAKKTTIHCRRCGRKSYHMTKKKCSACGFGKSARMRKYAWQKQD
jgi:large subunit ribosomal protein L37e